MTGLVDQYLAARVKHDPSGLPLSKGVGYTENTRGGVRSIKIQGVPGVDTIPMGGGTSNLQAGESFKIKDGKIYDIEAMGVSLLYGTKSGW
jgi:hypothetical protein